MKISQHPKQRSLCKKSKYVNIKEGASKRMQEGLKVVITRGRSEEDESKHKKTKIEVTSGA